MSGGGRGGVNLASVPFNVVVRWLFGGCRHSHSGCQFTCKHPVEAVCRTYSRLHGQTRRCVKCGHSV